MNFMTEVMIRRLGLWLFMLMTCDAFRRVVNVDMVLVNFHVHVGVTAFTAHWKPMTMIELFVTMIMMLMTFIMTLMIVTEMFMTFFGHLLPVGRGWFSHVDDYFCLTRW